MTAPFIIIEGVFASAIVDDGTLVIAYPAGYSSADTWGTAHVLVLDDNDVLEAGAETFSLAFGGSITFTNLSSATMAAGRSFRLQVDLVDDLAPTGQKQAAITVLTDNSGGTASYTIADVPGSYTEATLANQIASLVRQCNLLRAVLLEYGMIA